LPAYILFVGTLAGKMPALPNSCLLLAVICSLPYLFAGRYFFSTDATTT